MSVHIRTKNTQHDFKTITNAKGYLYGCPPPPYVKFLLVVTFIGQILVGSLILIWMTLIWSSAYWNGTLQKGSVL